MLPGSLANLSWLDCFRHHFMKPGFFFTIAKKSSAKALSQQRRAVRLSALHARAPHGHHFDQIQAPSCVSLSHLRNSTKNIPSFLPFFEKKWGPENFFAAAGPTGVPGVECGQSGVRLVKSIQLCEISRFLKFQTKRSHVKNFMDSNFPHCVLTLKKRKSLVSALG